MEEVQYAGQVHFHNMSLNEKDHVRKMFRDMDIDGDGRISKQELLSRLNSAMPANKIQTLFAKLDRDRSGSLDFSEFVTLYYVHISRPICDCRKDLANGLYYCCVQCWKRYINAEGLSEPYELCSDCYYGRKFRHVHNEFLDSYVLFRRKANLAEGSEKPKQSTTEAILKAGRLYFQALSTSDMCNMRVAHGLFMEMDLDGDGRVTPDEVVNFLSKKGLPPMEAFKVIQDMGIARNSYLHLEDVVALWYAYVMRPCCNGCKTMITGSYYTCVTCFNISVNGGDADTCDLCPECHSSGKFWHPHTFFLDNYVMLHMKNHSENLTFEQQGMGSSSGVVQGTEIGGRYVIRKIMEMMVKVSVEMVLGAAASSIVCTIM